MPQTLFNSRSTAGIINFRDLKAAQGQQETDYWGLSLKEGMEWLDHNADDFAWAKAADPDYYTKSLFNSVINSQVMNCFSPHPTPHTPHPTPHYPILFKQDLV